MGINIIKSANTDIVTAKHKKKGVSEVDFNNLPIGFAMGIAMHQDALDAYNRLTEYEKEKVIFECQDAKSKEDMDHIIERLTGNWF